MLEGLAAASIGILIGSILSKMRNKAAKRKQNENSSSSEKISSSSNSAGLLRQTPAITLCVRKDLGMGRGKIGAQCGHATLMIYEKGNKKCCQLMNEWQKSEEKPIQVLILHSEEEMMNLKRSAKEQGLITAIVYDAGRTQIEAGSATVLGIFGPQQITQKVTSHLETYK
ncbi:putative peptidyl-tRNA hydrolase 2 [Monocercomonoides exilis]|uniref:putative peptidyl-tRNA hydrolase 2 n=1 Tax=Monocercomonoides exilis TaxID=2049356 RepID=UPI00355A2EB5|nr:putative peptidyl-tRNA hydrolase 2 [Monocercomonoides exilis]|eukprot:MONOS_3553.1-p1 / transcript=MONOS_3553.1 / gene=MONOS_3553 / organism=Monocercomonoides_exilis_PA203 / gene_product=peptidyl-tRNA hydrolase 2, putative / transcript_product=peptidyl-tRNA hydrolase 2, putative / location=Mono_scaffold00084:86632-87309(-) / protein_length=169 / sequence_SO=supercontig / SO=protein_coding / is_pseudo=false